MMIEPPSVPSSGLYVVFVRSISADEGLAAADGSVEPAGAEAPDDADGDGLAAVPHAANTIIVLASKPTRRFRINTPPKVSVSLPTLPVTGTSSGAAASFDRLQVRSGCACVDGSKKGARADTRKRSAPALRV
jgi:hypothetical protein